MGHEFTIRREVALPATAEQVFAAVTTGAAGWMFPTDDMVGPGGAGPDNPIVTSWEPPTSSRSGWRARMAGSTRWRTSSRRGAAGRACCATSTAASWSTTGSASTTVPTSTRPSICTLSGST
jgi:hypothetical protein